MSKSLARNIRRPLVLSAVLLLGACAAPAVLKGEFASITPQQAALSESVAVSPVRWGGTILSSNNTPEQSCFEVLGRPLDYNARPLATDSEQGRFLACKSGFLDPALVKPGRDVTIVGAISGVEQRKVGDFDYRYPKLEAQTIYLWPERSQNDTYYVEPFFYPYPYYFYYPNHYHYRERPRANLEPSAPIPPDTGVSPPRRHADSPLRSSDEPIAPRVSKPVGDLLRR